MEKASKSDEKIQSPQKKAPTASSDFSWDGFEIKNGAGDKMTFEPDTSESQKTQFLRVFAKKFVDAPPTPTSDPMIAFREKQGALSARQIHSNQKFFGKNSQNLRAWSRQNQGTQVYDGDHYKTRYPLSDLLIHKSDPDIKLIPLKPDPNEKQAFALLACHSKVPSKPIKPVVYKTLHLTMARAAQTDKLMAQTLRAMALNLSDPSALLKLLKIAVRINNDSRLVNNELLHLAQVAQLAGKKNPDPGKALVKRLKAELQDYPVFKSRYTTSDWAEPPVELTQGKDPALLKFFRTLTKRTPPKPTFPTKGPKNRTNQGRKRDREEVSGDSGKGKKKSKKQKHNWCSKCKQRYGKTHSSCPRCATAQ